MNKPGSESWKNVDPDFDGHREMQLDEMTVEERLAWAWQGMQLLHWARQAKRDDDSPRPRSK